MRKVRFLLASLVSLAVLFLSSQAFCTPIASLISNPEACYDQAGALASPGYMDLFTSQPPAYTSPITQGFIPVQGLIFPLDQTGINGDITNWYMHLPSLHAEFLSVMDNSPAVSPEASDQPIMIILGTWLLGMGTLRKRGMKREKAPKSFEAARPFEKKQYAEVAVPAFSH